MEGGSSGDVCGALHEHQHDAKHHHLMLPGGGGVSYLLAGLFSLHSFVVGAALGTENSLNGAASLLIAIAAHKGAEAFAVGVEVRVRVTGNGDSFVSVVGTVLAFGLRLPIGISFSVGRGVSVAACVLRVGSLCARGWRWARRWASCWCTAP